jgi:4-amino-4-deoxy-L-arabinose transferase-like glycosyltransferase
MGHMGDRGAVVGREHYGLWHPPLYLYLLGLNVKLFGGSEYAARGMGIALVAATALVVYALGYTVGRGRRRPLCGLLATALFLASPLVVQSSVVIDIDGTLLLLAVTLWALLYLRWERAATPTRLAALGGLLAVGLWCKTSTPLLLPIAVVGYQALARRPARGLRHAAAVVAVGVPLFLATWGLVAALTGMPFTMPFEWNVWQFNDASRYTRSWLGDVRRMQAELAPSLVWTTPYLVALYGVVGLVRLAAWLRGQRARPVDFLLLVGSMIFFAYFIKLAANFPKYHVGAMPFLAAAIAWWLTAWLPRTHPAERLGWLAALGAVATYALWQVRDAWMWENARVWELPALGPALLLFVAAAVASLVPRWRAAAPRLGTGLLVLYLGCALVTDWTQARADYSTHFYYGTRGQREAAELLDATRYDGVWVGPKEIAWYAGNQHFVDADTFWWLVIARGMRFDGRVLGYEPRVVVVWTMDPEVRHFFWQRLTGRYEQVSEAGDYAIWVRSPSPPTVGFKAGLSGPSTVARPNFH